MEISSFRGLSETGFENSQIFNQWQAPSFDEFSILPLASALGEHMHSSFPQPTINFRASAENSSYSIGNLVKQPKASSQDSVKVDAIQNNQEITLPYINPDSIAQQFSGKLKDEAVCPNTIINLPYDVSFSQASCGIQNHPSNKTCLGGRWARTSCGRFPQTQDHIMAERKRREKLSQRFIALSALIPGLKKLKLKRLAPGLVELSSPSRGKALEPYSDVNPSGDAKTLLTPKHFATMWPVASVNGSNSNLLGFEALLTSVLGPKANKKGSFRLLKADVSAQTYVKIGFGVEKKLKEGDEAGFGFENYPEWRTKPESVRMHFEVLAKVDGKKIVPERVVPVQPVVIEGTVAPSLLTNNVTMSLMPIVQPPSSPFTL